MVSGSGATLVVLTIAVLGGPAAAAALEDIRTRLLVALGIHFDEQLATSLFERQIEVRRRRPRAPRRADHPRSRQRPPGADRQRHARPLRPAVVSAFHRASAFICIPSSAASRSSARCLVLAPRPRQPMAGGRAARQVGRRETEASYRLTEGASPTPKPCAPWACCPSSRGAGRRCASQAISSQASASTLNASISSVIKLLALRAAGADHGRRRLARGRPRALARRALRLVLICTRALLPIDQIVGVWRQLISGWRRCRGSRRRSPRPASAPGDEAAAAPRAAQRRGLIYRRPARAHPRSPTCRSRSSRAKRSASSARARPARSTLARLIVGAISRTQRQRAPRRGRDLELGPRRLRRARRLRVAERRALRGHDRREHRALPPGRQPRRSWPPRASPACTR